MTDLPFLEADGHLRILNLGKDENRFSPTWLDAVNAALDEVESDDSPLALITAGSGRFYSNGLDLDWLGQHPDELTSYVARVHALFRRVLTLPVPTVSAINGHAFGAGAMLAMAHDHRVMRGDRGYLCFPEADIQIPFTPGMSALIMSKVTPRTAVDAMTTGHRFDGPEALAAGLVDAMASVDALVGAAADRVRDHAGKHRDTLRTIKETMFADVIAELDRVD